MTTHVLELDNAEAWHSANDRGHWSRGHRLTKHWRQLATIYARKERIPALDRARIVVTFHKPTRRRYDPANYYPTVKAIVDGLVDAGVLPDDDGLHLVGPDMRAGEPGPRRIVIEITAWPGEVP